MPVSAPTRDAEAVGAPHGGWPSRIAALDGLRLLAALSVALFHYTVAWRADGVHTAKYFLPHASHVTVYGFLGVELFFMISGFVICRSGWGRSLGDFFVSRVTRLFPAYWAGVLITAVVVLLVPISGGVFALTQPSLVGIGVNLTMLPEPLGVPLVDTVYWTLFVELRFYLLFAIVIAFGLTFRRMVLFCFAWLIVATYSQLLESRIVDVIAVPDYASYFIAGILMFLIHRFGASTLLLGMLGITWLINLHAVTVRVSDLQPGFDVPIWPGILIITGSYLLILAIAMGRLDRVRWRWLSIAGVLTYPVYLLHQRIGYTMIRYLYEWLALPMWLLIAITLTTVLALAGLVHRYVETPLSRVLKHRLRASLHQITAADPAGSMPADRTAPPALAGRWTGVGVTPYEDRPRA